MIKRTHFLFGCVLGMGVIFALTFIWPAQPFGWWFVSSSRLLGLTADHSPVEIIFTGDLMMDRYIRQKATQHSYDYILENLRPTLTQVDLVVTNLEGPITNFSSRSLGSQIGSSSNYNFTMAPEVTQVLFNHQIKLVNLGNNHMLNFGPDGLAQTKHYLDQQGIRHFGYTGQGDDQVGLLLEIGQVKLGFVNYNQFAAGSLASALVEVERLTDQADLVVVYTHWGNEYQSEAGSTIQQTAHQLVEAGADAVIGSHPHVVQQTEKYQGKMIYYSLGNFVFDQYFSPATKHGLLVKMTIDSGTFQPTFVEIPVKMDLSGQTSLVN